MLPVRIITYLTRPQPSPTGIAPVQRPPDATTSTPLSVYDPAPRPSYERRHTGNRRMLERRGEEPTAFLDTRVPQGRRRSPGRRADDHYPPESRISISVTA